MGVGVIAAGVDSALWRGAGAGVLLRQRGRFEVVGVLSWRKGAATYHTAGGVQETTSQPVAAGWLLRHEVCLVEAVTWQGRGTPSLLSLAEAAGWWSGYLGAPTVPYAAWARAVLLEAPGTSARAHEARCRRAAGVAPQATERLPVRWPLDWPSWAPSTTHALDAAGLALHAAGWTPGADQP